MDDNVEVIEKKNKPLKRVILCSIFLIIATISFIATCLMFASIRDLLNGGDAKTAEEALGIGIAAIVVVVIWFLVLSFSGILSIVAFLVSLFNLKKTVNYSKYHLINIIECIIPVLYVITDMVLLILL